MEPTIWFVWNSRGGYPFARHQTEESAKSEAMRLASINRKETFYVLKTVGTMRAVDVEWKETKEEDEVIF